MAIPLRIDFALIVRSPRSRHFGDAPEDDACVIPVPTFKLLPSRHSGSPSWASIYREKIFFSKARPTFFGPKWARCLVLKRKNFFGRCLLRHVVGGCSGKHEKSPERT
jgi:hypothetical protein